MALRQLGLQVVCVGAQVIVVVLGSTVAMVQWGAAQSLVGWVFSIALVSILQWLWTSRDQRDRRDRPRQPAPRPSWSVVSGHGTSAALLLCSLALLLHAPGGLHVVVVVVIALAVVPATWVDSTLTRLSTRRVRKPRKIATRGERPDLGQLSLAATAEQIDEALLPALSSEELCRAWRCSYVVLRRARSAAEVALVADSRCRYLAEMERRWPSAVSTWLGSGARAASGPERLLRRPGPHSRGQSR